MARLYVQGAQDATATFKFDPETKRVTGVAFEMARLARGLSDQGDLANNIVAKRTIELAKGGKGARHNNAHSRLKSPNSGIGDLGSGGGRP
jgi:hypothetical protein